MSTQTTPSAPRTGTTFAPVGAGPGLGAAAAPRFAAEGFAVPLLARTPSRLDDLRVFAAPLDPSPGTPAQDPR